MSVLSSTLMGEIPDRDRYGVEDGEHPITLHIARAFIELVHISLEQGDNYLEVNLTVEEARRVLGGLAEAIEGATRGYKSWTPEGAL